MKNHPFRLYFDRGFRVTINTDDRLMSNTSMTKEFQIAMTEFGLSLNDVEKITLNSIKSAFIPFDERLRLIYDVIKPGYRHARKESGIKPPS